MLSERQKQIMKAINDYVWEHEFSPTVRELCSIVGLKSTSSMQRHLDNLQDMGYINRMSESPRTIKILREIE